MAKIIKCKGTESISRDLIFDNELSDRARFVYCYMMAKPDDWEFYVGAMAKDLGYSEDTLHKYINELIERGWLEKNEQARDKNNKWGAVSYTIYETRRPKKAVTENFRDGKIPSQTNIDFKEIKEDKKEKEKLFKKKEDADYYDGLLTLNINKDIAMDFMQLRKTKKATNSARSFELVKRAIKTVTQRLNITPTNVIEICLAKGWYGCQVSYFDSVKLSDFGITPISQSSTALKSPHEKMDEMGNRYYIQGSTKVIIPPDAPPRPNPMVYWNTIYNQWYQPF